MCPNAVIADGPKAMGAAAVRIDRLKAIASVPHALIGRLRRLHAARADNA